MVSLIASFHAHSGRGKNAKPVSERTQIVLRGNVLLGENPDDEELPSSSAR